MKRILWIALAGVLMVALLVPLTVSAAQPDGNGPANDFQVVTKTGAKGITDMGPPMRGTKPVASTGTIGAGGGGTGYAVVVGIADYPGDSLDLHFADDDADLMASALMWVYGYQNIVVLKDQAASRTAILAAIADVAESAVAGDEVVFFFSGHAVKLMRNARGGGNVGILTWGMETPYGDFPEAISDKELKAAFAAVQTDRQVFIFDSCLGAAFSEIGGKGSIVVAASGQAGTAAEARPGDGIDQGIFTSILVGAGMFGALTEENPADLNGDELVTIEEAYDFTRGTLEYMNQLYAGIMWQVPAISDHYKNDLLPGAQ